ncbi:hypothetical protein HY480_03920, partial [Candidatus Uhrbacteria bacterium]|nr:hypothetical protein [Candidatus Uhrbacteria bacterium]
MVIFWLLLVPVLIGLGGLAFGKGRITWKEFLVHEGVVILVIGIGYAIAYWSQTTDTEIWNGTITSKTTDRMQCCHSYSCDCRQVCHGSGNERSCHTECDTCY